MPFTSRQDIMRQATVAIFITIVALQHDRPSEWRVLLPFLPYDCVGFCFCSLVLEGIDYEYCSLCDVLRKLWNQTMMTI